MKKTYSALRLNWWLLVSSLLAMACLLALNLYSDHKNTWSTESARVAKQAEVIEINLGMQLQSTSNALDQLRTNLHTLQAGAPDNLLINNRLTSMAAVITGVRSLLVINAAGDCIASNRKELIGLNFSKDDRYLTISKGIDPFLLYVSPPLPTPLQTYAISVGKLFLDDDGHFDGYLAAVLDADYFRVLLSSVLYAPDMRATLIHPDGKVVYSVPTDDRFTGTDLKNAPNALFWQYLQGGGKQKSFVGPVVIDGSSRLVEFRSIHLPTSPISKSLVISVSREIPVIFSAWTQNLYLTTALFGAFALACILGLRSYQRRLQAIEILSELREHERSLGEQEIIDLNAELEAKVEARTAELALANSALHALSRRDALTGVPNRLAANEHLHSEFVSMMRSSSNYSLLMIDIDHFKRINDTYGHAVGDRVLQQVAHALQTTLRESDFVARFGGEEFLALLPNTQQAAACQVAEKIRKAVESLTDPTAGQVTVSIGFAIASPEHKTEDEAVRLADDCLYQAKNAGRNQVVGC